MLPADMMLVGYCNGQLSSPTSANVCSEEQLFGTWNTPLPSPCVASAVVSEQKRILAMNPQSPDLDPDPYPFALLVVSLVHLARWAQPHRPICCFSVSSGTLPAPAFLLAVVAPQNFLLPDVTSSSDNKFIFIGCHFLTSIFLATPSKVTPLGPTTKAPAPHFAFHPSLLLHFSLYYHLRMQIFYLFIICFP